MRSQRFNEATAENFPWGSGAAAPAQCGLILCPVPVAAAGGWVSEMYRIAWERAQEAVARPKHERYLAPTLN